MKIDLGSQKQFGKHIVCKLTGTCCCFPRMPKPAPVTANLQRKIAVLGYRAVGKTCAATVFVEDNFLERYDPTIENTFRKIIRFRKVHFTTDIVDTAGMDEYARLSRNASLGVHGYLMFYSITSKVSFEKIKLINEVLLNMLGDTPDVPRVLVGSMVDLADQRQVPSEDGQSLADQWNCPFMECSAKQNLNITEVFSAIVKEIERDNRLLASENPTMCRVL